MTAADPCPGGADRDDLFKTVWDVVVVGGGPAGARAALMSARQGAATLLIDRAELPRYKTCGGGLTGTSIALLAGTPECTMRDKLPMKDAIVRTVMTREGRSRAVTQYRQPIMVTVDRDVFDAALVDRAKAAGARIATGMTLRAVSQEAGEVLLDVGFRAGPDSQQRRTLRARAVVGADGTGGRCAAVVGASYRQVDVGLEMELRMPAEMARQWKGTIALDWGRLPGSYGWLFPKGEIATVGVIAERGDPSSLREYLNKWVTHLDLDAAEVIRSSGHLTRTRTADSPCGSGRVLLAGDAAGLVEPWTREGISYALRSGDVAGELAARLAAARDDAGCSCIVRRYESWIVSTIQPELDAAGIFVRYFSRHTRLVHWLLTRTARGRAAFAQVSRGEKRLSRALRRRSVRVLLALDH